MFWATCPASSRQYRSALVPYLEAVRETSTVMTKHTGWLSRHRRPYRLEIVSRPKGATKFKPLPVRWVVERTYAWQGRYRCLSKDYYEHTPEASETMIRIAAVHHLLQRLRPKGRPYSQRFRFKRPRKTVR